MKNILFGAWLVFQFLLIGEFIKRWMWRQSHDLAWADLVGIGLYFASFMAHGMIWMAYKRMFRWQQRKAPPGANQTG